MTEFGLRTDRLVLREWRDADRAPFAAMNADPEVMEFLLATLSGEQSDALVDQFTSEWAARRYCPWAVELVDAATFIGFVGLHDVPAAMPFAPAVEIGWRLARRHWGFGYATEAATEALGYAFGEFRLEEVVAFTAAANDRSRRVMANIGMTHDPAEDFEHPNVPVHHHLRSHVLYRQRRGRPSPPS